MGRRPPAALARRPVELLLVIGPLDLDRLLVRLGDEPQRVQPDRQLPAVRAARARACRARRTARSARAGRAMTASISGRPKRAARTHRLRAAADAHPGRDVPLGDRRAHELIGERRAELPRPGHRLVAQQADEQVELLLEQLLVVGEVEPEQREGVRQRAAADDQLRAAVRDGVERREVGVEAHRVLGAQHRDGGAEPDPLGSARDRGEDDVAAESMNSVR